jgi:hypothetical protein
MLSDGRRDRDGLQPDHVLSLHTSIQRVDLLCHPPTKGVSIVG